MVDSQYYTGIRAKIDIGYRQSIITLSKIGKIIHFKPYFQQANPWVGFSNFTIYILSISFFCKSHIPSFGSPKNLLNFPCILFNLFAIHFLTIICGLTLLKGRWLQKCQNFGNWFRCQSSLIGKTIRPSP